MKRALPIFLGWLAVICLVTLALRSQTDVGPIQWEWRHGRILERYDAGTKLQFGLREDGVVVWREVTFETNSPAEMLFRRNRMAPTVVPPAPTANRLAFPTNTSLLPPPLPQ